MSHEVVIIAIFIVLIYISVAHYISYFMEKKRILNRQTWDLNICCGKTDGGGLNVDIYKHKDVPNFRLVNDIYNLPFADGSFDTVLSSHTIEHVDHPVQFYEELVRVGKNVTIVVPPLYDLAAVLNLFEHKWIFLTFKKEHQTLPRFIRFPFSDVFHSLFGQKNNA